MQSFGILAGKIKLCVENKPNNDTASSRIISTLMRNFENEFFSSPSLGETCSNFFLRCGEHRALAELGCFVPTRADACYSPFLNFMEAPRFANFGCPDFVHVSPPPRSCSTLITFSSPNEHAKPPVASRRARIARST